MLNYLTKNMLAQRGDIRVYQESMNIYEVLVLNSREVNEKSFCGEEYELKIRRILQSQTGNWPDRGKEFKVKRAKDSCQEGWSFLDVAHG